MTLRKSILEPLRKGMGSFCTFFTLCNCHAQGLRARKEEAALILEGPHLRKFIARGFKSAVDTEMEPLKLGAEQAHSIRDGELASMRETSLKRNKCYGTLKCCRASILIFWLKTGDGIRDVGTKKGFSMTFKYSSCASLKNAFTDSSLRPSCSIRNLIWAAVTNAETCREILD